MQGQSRFGKLVRGATGLSPVLFGGASLMVLAASALPTQSGESCTSQQSFVYTGGGQTFPVPGAGTVTLDVIGAAGGNSHAFFGGQGAEVSGTFTFPASALLVMFVGQPGGTYDTGTFGAGGGGGGSFVVAGPAVLAVAGGGGGAGQAFNGVNGAPIATGTSSAGTNGTGSGGAGGSDGLGGGVAAYADYGGGGGGGVINAGASDDTGNENGGGGGAAASDTAIGGAGYVLEDTGGYGSGGGGGDGAGGGGGGYSGGGGGDGEADGGGGGGGSFIGPGTLTLSQNTIAPASVSVCFNAAVSVPTLSFQAALAMLAGLALTGLTLLRRRRNGGAA